MTEREQLAFAGTRSGATPMIEICRRCGHPADWHRLDDSTNVSPVDPAAEFRCLGYDCTAPGPVPPGGRACDCPDMVRSEAGTLDEGGAL